MSQTTLKPRGPAARETPRFIDVGGEQVYCFLHEPVVPLKGRVLLLGPLPSERPYAHASWVAWARFLAGRGLAVLRFDYRGTGESTGAFADFDLQEWLSDARAAVRELPGTQTPLVLCGLRLGALLGARLLEEGLGDRLLAWGPPKSARDHLMEVLRRRLAEDMALALPGPRRTRKDYIGDIEAGRNVNVDGYPWSKRLWNSAEGMASPAQEQGRIQVVHLLHSGRDLCTRSGEAWRVQIPRPPFWVEGPWFTPDLDSLFTASAAWIEDSMEQEAPT